MGLHDRGQTEEELQAQLEEHENRDLQEKFASDNMSSAAPTEVGASAQEFHEQLGGSEDADDTDYDEFVGDADSSSEDEHPKDLLD